MAEIRKMAKVAVSPEYRPETGTISAYTVVTATGFNGVPVFKRVRIGVEFGVTPETAKGMMAGIRLSNADAGNTNISGRFVMEM